jgi:hypothetical protein
VYNETTTHKEYTVTNKITRAKERIQKHRTKILFGSGVLAGVAGTIVLGHRIGMRRVPFELFLATSREHLQALLDNPDGAIQWTHTTGSVINVINEVHPQIQ